MTREAPSATAPPSSLTVMAYVADVREVWVDAARVERARAWLAPAEAARFDRFRLDVDRQMFLLGRVMARALVSRALGVAPMAWEWREGPHGRPEIASPATPMHFNISHSAGVVVCAVAADREVGVDVEDRHRRATAREVVDRYCAPVEIEDIGRQTPDRWRDRFLEYWTLKEAYLKARGLGIAVPLSEIAFHLGPPIAIEFTGPLAGLDTRWAFTLEPVATHHLAAVAVPVAEAASPPHVQFATFPASWLP